MNKIDWIRKLSSRKFWLAGFISGLIIYFGGSPERAKATEGLILSGSAIIVYMLAEAVADAAHVEEYEGKHLSDDESD